MKFYKDPVVTLWNGDCRNMSELPDGSVQMAVTSPPYWGLRKYAGLPDLVWDGDGSCKHTEMIPSPEPNVPKAGNKQRDYIEDGQYTGKHKWQHDLNVIGTEHRGNTGLHPDTPTTTEKNKATSGSFCSLCGAWRGQLGLEPTPEMYIDHLVGIFREVRRVLRKDGVVFLNIGDSYVSGKSRYSSKEQTISGKDRGDVFGGKPDQYYHPFLKDKDLCLIPFRLAIALQEDSWWVRSVIIWSKNNPMPESVTDRPTESHEYILMLTKSSRYYYDQEATRERYQSSSIERAKYPVNAYGTSEWGVPLSKTNVSGYTDVSINPYGRNLRSVWEFSTQSYKEAHFATYPEELVRRCVLAATPEAGCCPKCGKPWVRISEKKLIPQATRQPDHKENWHSWDVMGTNEVQTLGWKPQCKCGLPQSENIGSIVLDPFAGSCTSLSVAKRLGRRAIGYELSKQYCALGVRRIEAETAPMRLEE